MTDTAITKGCVEEDEISSSASTWTDGSAEGAIVGRLDGRGAVGLVVGNREGATVGDKLGTSLG